MASALNINDSLKNHLVSEAVTSWRDKDWARCLHQWCADMNAAFDLQLETPAIAIDQPRFRAAGGYRAGFNCLIPVRNRRALRGSASCVPVQRCRPALRGDAERGGGDPGFCCA
jgi:hypothetical protein